MKKIFLLCSVLALGAAKPNGYFHQEYSYKSSQASYKNNELQHKKDDAGFYSKDGDLEGRVKPKVTSDSQHSEYTNPKLLSESTGYQAAGYSGASGANYLASSDRLFGGANSLQNAGAVDGYASADRVLDLSNVYSNRGYSSGQGYSSNLGYGSSQGYGSNQGYRTLNGGGRYGQSSNNYGYTQGGSSYGYSQQGSSQATSGSYGSNANLNALMQRLQDDMTRQLEHAVYKQYQSSSYGSSISNSQMNADIRLLEDELKRNLTRQLQDSLRTQYGSSGYTIVEGNPTNVPNYSNQELASLTRRLEDDLISKLHQSVRTSYNSYTYSSSTYRPVVGYPVTTSRPYYDRPVITAPTNIRYTMVPGREVVTYPGQLVVETPSNIRYTPIPNPESLTQIASRTQADINSYLDTAIDNLYSTYLQSDRTSYYTMADFDNEVNRIKDEIIRNLTYHLDDQIRRNYGQQILKNDYYYTISSNGDMSTQSNYNLKDYENLKKQVEENLLRKLNQTVNTYRDQYQTRQSQYRESSSNTYAVTYKPTYYTSGNQLYDYSDLQRQMTQQVQDALNKHRYSHSSSYSASTSYNPQAYQTSLDELTRELQRNLTEQLRNFRASASSSSSYGYSSGTSGGSANFESMKNQLQNQLMQQLRQGLQSQQQYSASASYSASSSSSANANYGMHQSYGSYPSTCTHGCRRKRDLYRRFSNFEKRNGVKSVRRLTSQSSSNSDSSARYLHHPEDLSYPSTHGAQFQQQSSYSTSLNSMHSKKHYSLGEVEPDIVEDLGTLVHPSLSTSSVNQQTQHEEDDLQQLEQTPSKHFTIKYAKQNELPQQQLETTQELKRIQDDLTQQLQFGHQATQKIHHFSGRLEDDSTQQLEEIPSRRSFKQEYHTVSHTVGKYERKQEAQLNLNIPSFGQQLEDQNTIRRLRKPNYGQELEGQSNLDQLVLGQQLEDQDVIGRSKKPKHNEVDQDGQLNLSQQTLGAQMEDQNIIGKLQKPDDQEIEGQLNLEQKTLGQQIEDQNIIGNLYKPQQVNQELENQLNLDTQTLKDQSLMVNSHKPKHYTQELEGQLHLGGQLEDQNTILHLRKPKDNKQKLEVQSSITPLDEAIRTHLRKPIYTGQEMVGQISSSQTLGQQLEDQNTDQESQQLELEHFNRPKLEQVQQQSEDIPFQQLELGTVRKPKDSDQQPDDLTQQLETIELGKPKHSDFEQQQSNVDEISLDQQQGDLTQQLELTPLENKLKPSAVHLELKPVQIPQQQIEDDNVQKLELEENPRRLHQEPQQVDDFTQQLEVGNPQYRKTDQQLQNQEDLGQNLEYLGGPTTDLHSTIHKNTDQEIQQKVDDDVPQQLEYSQKSNPQVTENDFTQQLVLTNARKPTSNQIYLNQEQQQIENEPNERPKSHFVLNKPKKVIAQKLETTLTISGPDANQKLEEPDQKLEEPDQKLEEPDQKLEEPDQKLEEPDQKLEEPGEKLEELSQKLEEQDQKLEELGQKLEGPNQKLEESDQKLEELGQKLEEPDQKLEEPEQKLEIASFGRTTIAPQQIIVNQKVEEDLNQQLELTDVQKPKKVNFADQEGQQLENDFTSLDLSGARESKPNPQYIPTLEADLSFTSDTKQPDNGQRTTQTIRIGYQPSRQDDRTTSLHSQYSNTVQNEVSQSRHHPTRVFTDYGVSRGYGQEPEVQRPFTNGHSGHSNGYYRSSGSQVRMDSYENALRQQDALMDLLKQKVQEAHSSNQDVYGQRTIKKTVFINGKAVDTQESSQLIKPNGEIVELKGESPLKSISSKNMYNGQVDTYLPTQSTGYSGNTIRRTYHVSGSPTIFSGTSQLFTQGPLEDHFSHFDLDQNGGKFQAQSQLSGKATRTIVHYVNGKPVSASEKIEILKPNGEIIERNHDLPTGELNAFSRGFSSNGFRQTIPSSNLPGTYMSSQKSQVSEHTLHKTSHYVNGKLVDFDSSIQRTNPNDVIREIYGIPEKNHYHSSGIKTSGNYASLEY